MSTTAIQTEITKLLRDEMKGFPATLEYIISRMDGIDNGVMTGYVLMLLIDSGMVETVREINGKTVRKTGYSWKIS